MHYPTTAPVSCVTLLLALSACTPGGRWSSSGAEGESRIENDPRLREVVDTVCFSSGINGFREVAEQAVVLKKSSTEGYLVRTGHCSKLRGVEGLKIDDPSGCLKRGDLLNVYDSQFPRAGDPLHKPDRCRVMAIHKWTETR
jgi:hypothetical protein